MSTYPDSEIVEWCEKRDMNVADTDGLWEASEPGLTIVFEDGEFAFEIVNPEVGLKTVIYSNSVEVSGNELAAIKSNGERTVLKSS